MKRRHLSLCGLTLALLLAPGRHAAADAPVPGATRVAVAASPARPADTLPALPAAVPPAPAAPASAAAETAEAPGALTLPGPIDPAWTQALSSVTPDPAPPELVRNTHYIVSNEDRHDFFRTSLQNRGGVFIGVGSDQNYVMAGWARPELLVLMDFDQVVVNLHRVYRVLFLQANTPQEFADLWKIANEKQVVALIEAAHADQPTRSALYRAYRLSRYAVVRRLELVRSVYGQHGVRSFVDDIDQYRYLQGLFRQDRVLMLRGDLTKGGALSGVATAATAIGAKVRVLYLSNAERYFTYTDGFKKSMTALPMDDRSLVLRTRARINGTYEYIMQEGANFQSWLNDGKVGQAFQMTRFREPSPDGTTFVIRRLPAGRAPAQAPATDKRAG